MEEIPEETCKVIGSLSTDVVKVERMANTVHYCKHRKNMAHQGQNILYRFATCYAKFLSLLQSHC